MKVDSYPNTPVFEMLKTEVLPTDIEIPGLLYSRLGVHYDIRDMHDDWYQWYEDNAFKGPRRKDFTRFDFEDLVTRFEWLEAHTPGWKLEQKIIEELEIKTDYSGLPEPIMEEKLKFYIAFSNKDHAMLYKLVW